MAMRKILEKVPKMGTMFNIGMGALDYMEARNEGQGVISSLGSAAVGYAIPEVLGFKGYLAFEAIRTLPSVATEAYESLSTTMRLNEKMKRNQAPFQQMTFVDGPQIATMRQAGLALAKRSKYELQNTMMGNEARYLHR